MKPCENKMKLWLLICSLFLTMSLLGQTPSSNISDEEKIVGLSTVWTEAKYNFANFDLAKINWDSVYQVSIPKILSTKSTEEYYKELAKVVALLRDGHSIVLYKLSYFDAMRPPIPIRTKLVENKVIITAIYNDTLRMNNIEVGDEITEIDKVNVIEYATKNIMPYQFASTIQDLNAKTYYFSLLQGEADKPIELTIKKKNNKTFTTTISRKLVSNYQKQSYELEITKDNIAYLKINSFYDQRHKEVFDSLYMKILSTKALIIDIRDNGGGNTGEGYYVLSHLIEKQSYGSKSKTRRNISAFRANGQTDDWMEFPPNVLKPVEGKAKYLKPVVVLTSARTYSAAEDFLVAFDSASRGIKIGQATGGSTGQPLQINLPDGGTAFVCAKRDAYPDDKEFVGIGIKPEIEVVETVKSIQENKDLVLEKAIDFLNKKK